jgi:hypothetical protein
MAVPDPTPICHSTHWNNLPAIVAAGGLDCCATLRKEPRKNNLVNFPTCAELWCNSILREKRKALIAGEPFPRHLL